MQNKEPRWSVSYTIHLDDKNGKIYGTLYYTSGASESKAAILSEHVDLAQGLARSVQSGRKYRIIFGPDNESGLTEDSDFGVFSNVTAFQFCVTDLWENTADE